MPYPSYRFHDAKLLESGNPVSYTDHTQLTIGIIHVFSWPHVQTSSEGPDKCKCTEINMFDHYSCILYDSMGGVFHNQ